jgi:acyl carrier protein
VQNSLSEIVRQVFTDELGVGPEIFNQDLTYNSIPEWDSASHMVMVVALEEKLGIEFDSDEIVTLTSVRKIVEALESRDLYAE